MKPILYSSSETAFDTNGIGILSDATKCNVVKELNGKCELTLQYPANGVHRKSIVRRSIISAKPDPLSKPQPFRVYRIIPSSNGTLTAYARHLAYDLIGITVSPFAAIGAASALAAIPGNATTACPFTFWTDKTSSTAFNLPTPRSVWKLLGGAAGSILDTYGGEYEFDGYTVRLWNRLGANRGAQIRYGKNLTSLEQDENCANCYTAIHPYWAGTDGTSVQLVQLPERIVNAPGTYDHIRILPVDFSTEWLAPPTEEELRKRANAYIADNNIGMPDVSLSVQFVHLDQTEEYKDRAILERVVLGDTCDVFFPDMSVTSSSRVVATDYDVLRDTYNSVALGKVKASIAQTLVQQNKDLEKKPSLSTVQQISMQLTARIMGARGGAVRHLDADGDGLPDELYIADNNDPAQARKVWRFNYQGWAGSQNGYNGPFILGATFDDGLLAHAVKAANLVAGTIASADGTTFFLDLDNGILRMKAVDDLRKEAIIEPKISGQGADVVTISGVLTDGFENIRLFGKTTQDGTPSPESPVALESVGAGGRVAVTVSNDFEDTNAQIIIVSTPNGLPGIPVPNGGNYTDANGQQWICDEVDFARGVHVQRVEKTPMIGRTWWWDTQPVTAGYRLRGRPGTRYRYDNDAVLCDSFPTKNTWLNENCIAVGNNILYVNTQAFGSPPVIEDWYAYLEANPITVMLALAEPIETPLSAEEMAQYAALRAKKPYTTVWNDGGAGMEIQMSGFAAESVVKQAVTEFKISSDGVSSRVQATEGLIAEEKNNTAALGDELNEVKENVNTKVSWTEFNQMNKEFNWSIGETQKALADKADKAEVAEITEHFRFAEDGMTITNTGTGMGIGVSEQRVIFTGGEDPTTIVRPNDMETTNLRVKKRLDVGGFAWIPRTNGNLSLRWTGEGE